MREPAVTDAPGERGQSETRPLVTVVVPVYNQAGTIVENVRTIRERVERGVDGAVEVIVVSDGSIDGSEERLLEDESHLARVIHYDRNLGKGFAVKAGSLAATGRYISYVDADLDLDPAGIPSFLELAQRDDLDFVIGSKRHAESRVEYPRARRVSSWMYQQLVRVLFRLDVRDTQVGLKVFRREVAEEVMPLLLVKQYAFDLELLAVAHALGFRRLREMPVTLEYRFTGSGVRSIAVLYALVDTAAIFYRLRVLRYYQRRRELLLGVVHGPETRPRVTLVTSDPDAAARFEYPGLEVVEVAGDAPEARRAAARRASGDVLAFLAPGASPAGNWLDSTVPFLGRDDIAAVVVPTMAPVGGSDRQHGASGVSESRLGGGSLHFRSTPGNLRFVDIFPADTVVVRRSDYLALPETAQSAHRLARALADSGRRIVYTPDTVVVQAQPPLFGPHLRRAAESGHGRGRDLRLEGLRALRPLTLAPVALFAFAVAGWPLALMGGVALDVWAAVWLLYGLMIGGASVSAALRYRSARVGLLVAAGIPLTHLAHAVGFLRGAVRRP